ncbi:Similar to S.cerevisiae protein ACP1 (Mitochondrial matrix acyl carrier protein) [Malassezia sympodialis ATCC 42132]|uniref:Acyl carrier protein n=1 Tax=Malassezia sympodialis (strain ATCC 42132) TaxID=1230383 RepID=A0A1M8A9J2_MALS4|nr:Similar to S.cerevisiae protein ACP1 (Mitochondrial matrix acyl carrier protein) [Malassezia sympodialis ATCC 42132]
MLTAATSMFPRALRASPMLARAAPVMRVPLARMPAAAPVLVRGYASAGGPSLEEIKARINEVLKSFEKVDAAKLTPTASFMGDLGLDSLDSVEVVMAIEEEFNIEIPDADADAITTVQQAVDYIANTPDAL